MKRCSTTPARSTSSLRIYLGLGTWFLATKREGWSALKGGRERRLHRGDGEGSVQLKWESLSGKDVATWCVCKVHDEVDWVMILCDQIDGTMRLRDHIEIIWCNWAGLPWLELMTSGVESQMQMKRCSNTPVSATSSLRIYLGSGTWFLDTKREGWSAWKGGAGEEAPQGRGRRSCTVWLNGESLSGKDMATWCGCMMRLIERWGLHVRVDRAMRLRNHFRITRCNWVSLLWF